MTYGGEAFVVNPPDVDEFQLVARVSGLHDVPARAEATLSTRKKSECAMPQRSASVMRIST